MIRFPAFHVEPHVEPNLRGSPGTAAQPHETGPADSPRKPSAQTGNARQHGEPPGRQAPASTASRIPGRDTRPGMGSSARSRPTLPDAYIGSPRGDLRSDAGQAGVWVDESGQRYASIGQHEYAVRYDAANGTWRAIQLQDRTKPGIPIRRDDAGNWQVHGEVGLPAGQPIPTRAQIMDDQRAMEATLTGLRARRAPLTQELHRLQNLRDEHAAYRREARDNLRELRDALQFSEGMADYFARQIERGNQDPSFRNALDAMVDDAQRLRTAITQIQLLHDHSHAYSETLPPQIAAARAELQHTASSILHAARRILDLGQLARELE
jgi:signal transduction histidine kinase